jgi:hypothetical protein
MAALCASRSATESVPDDEPEPMEVPEGEPSEPAIANVVTNTKLAIRIRLKMTRIIGGLSSRADLLFCLDQFVEKWVRAGCVQRTVLAYRQNQRIGVGAVDRLESDLVTVNGILPVDVHLADVSPVNRSGYEA